MLEAVRELRPPPAREQPARRALVVEPASALHRVLRKFLEELGFEVCVVTGAEEAVTIAASKTDYQILITEIVLAGISGRTLAGFVRKRMPHARVVYLCDDIHPDNVEVYGDAALEKPFSPAQLSALIDRLLARPHGSG